MALLTGRILSLRRALLALVLAGALTPALAQSRAAPGEYELKAAFIYRIAGFVEWPGKRAATPRSPMRLCVLGDNPFGAALESLRGKMVQGRPLEIGFPDITDPLKECHLLFVAAAADRHLERISALAREAGILTIGDGAGHARRGIMLGFYLDGDRLRFEVNLDAAQRSGLNLSSKLLSLARIVDTASP